MLVRDRVTRDRVVAGLGERGVEVRALEAGTVKPGYLGGAGRCTGRRARVHAGAAVRVEQGLDDGASKAYDFDDAEPSEGAAAGTVAVVRGGRRGRAMSWS